MAAHIDDHFTMLRWDILVEHLNDISRYFGPLSATGQISADIISMGNYLKSNNQLTGVNAFLAINALLYDSHNGRGLLLRRKFHRLRAHMNYLA